MIEQELIISLLQQLNKTLARAVKLEEFIAGELLKGIKNGKVVPRTPANSRREKK